MNKVKSDTRALRRVSKMYDVSVATVLLFGCTTEVAFAYIDPGSASVIITAVLGIIGAAAYNVRHTCSVLRQRFFGKESNEQEPLGEQEQLKESEKLQ